MEDSSKISHLSKGAEDISGVDAENNVNVLQEKYPQSVANIVVHPQDTRKVPLGYESVPPQNWLLDFRSLNDGNTWWRDVGKILPDVDRLKEKAKKNGGDNLNSPTFGSYFITPFEKMKLAMAHILLESRLAEFVAEGQYAYILGEDSTGRIPTLFLKSTIDILAALSNQRKPEIRFYAGFGHPDRTDNMAKDSLEYQELKEKWEEGMEEFIQKLKATLSLSTGNRILICTDVMGSGASMQNLSKILEKYQIDFDILSFGNQDMKMDMFQGHRVFNGRLWQDDFNNNLRRNNVISGVWKIQGDIHARSAKIDIPDIFRDDVGKDAREVLLKLINNPRDAMKLSRDLAKYLGANVAQAYLDYKAGKFELPPVK